MNLSSCLDLRFITILLGLLLVVKADSGDVYEKCTRSDCSGKTACATIYQHRDFYGWYQCLKFRSDECITLNSWWIVDIYSRVSGVDSHDTCVRLYRDRDCIGPALEIRPGSPDHAYLNRQGFEDEAKSVSSCSRSPEKNKKCYIQKSSLFNKNIKTDEVAQANGKILGVIDKFTSIAVSGVSIFIPGLNLFYDGLRIVTGLFNSEASIAAMIDERIEKSVTSQVKAKINIINFRLESLLSSDTSQQDRRSDLVAALHTCQEVKQLFQDSDYSFQRNKVISSPLIAAFSSVYLSVAKLVHVMGPEMRSRVATEMRQLADLNKDYMEGAISGRKGKFSWDRWYKHGFIIQDRMLCSEKPGWMGIDVIRPDGCYEYGVCFYWESCERCQDNINSSIDKEIRKFFTPVINKLNKFPN